MTTTTPASRRSVVPIARRSAVVDIGQPALSESREKLRLLARHRMAMLGLAIIALIGGAALLAPWLAPYPVDEPHLQFIRAAPSRQFLLGTDSLGRDMLSRLLYGARIAFMIAAVIVAIEVIIGVPLGMVAGYYGGRIDLLFNILTDVIWAFPPLVLALGVVAVLGSGLFNAILAIAFVSWAPFARVTRAKVRSLRGREFVEASIALGSSHGRILRRQILPHVIATNLVLVMLTLPGALLAAASLSFLGFGVQPPTPEWGAMLNEGRLYLQEAPWMSTFPGLAILLTVVGFNLFGEGVRDVLDPQQTK